MSTVHSVKYLTGLVRELCGHIGEVEWVEFKHNMADPQEIGEYISALANAAALNGKIHAYVLWGINDKTHDIIGTCFNPAVARKGNEALESWLLRLLSPRIHFRFHTVDIDNKQVVILEIERATRDPVSFRNTEYIRIGEVKKPLKEAPERERELWRTFDQTPFEALVVTERKKTDEVSRLLDYPAYFELLNLPLPVNREEIIEALLEDGLIQSCPAGGWDITNLGAILLAKRLTDFPSLSRKAIRVIQYRGKSRIETIKEKSNIKGYAAGFEGLVDYVNGLLPSNEIIEQALRKITPMYPELAIRELIANALIHQNFFVTGAGPIVEIFDDRVEITNPGKPLVAPDRFVDMPPHSRNEALASLMRRFRICEERGSGIDKVIYQVELYQLPAPMFEVPGESTHLVLFAYKDLKDISKRDRIRACYLHSCLCYVTHRRMTNATLRKRFGIADQNAAEASRLLKEAVEDGTIVIEDLSVGTRSRTYLPFWANPIADETVNIV